MDWSLDVDYRTKTFSGKVSIHVEDADPTLTVDSADLVIDETRLDGRPLSFVDDPTAGVLRFEQFPAGRIAWRWPIEGPSTRIRWSVCTPLLLDRATF